MCLHCASLSGSPSADLREPSCKAHLCTLAQGRSSCVRLCTHPVLLHRCESKTRRLHMLPIPRETCHSGASPSPDPAGPARAVGCPLVADRRTTKTEALVLLTRKCCPNGLRAPSQFTKMEKEKKEKTPSIRLQSLFGECVSKGNFHAMETNP